MARFDFIACYRLASRRQGTLYTGVTSDLFQRRCVYLIWKVERAAPVILSNVPVLAPGTGPGGALWEGLPKTRALTSRRSDQTQSVDPT